MSCSSCFSVLLPQCPDSILINGGLDENTRYRWEIENKFGQIFNGITDTDATGLLAINIIDDPDIPKGLFMSFSGSFILKAYKWLNAFEIENAAFMINDASYDCAELMFKDYRPATSYFDPDAPIYVPPTNTPIDFPFVNQTVVVVLHSLGYRPFIWIEDELGNVISGDVVHDSNIQFTVTFSSITSGIIHYR